jgi:hypothetical protein
MMIRRNRGPRVTETAGLPLRGPTKRWTLLAAVSLAAGAWPYIVSFLVPVLAGEVGPSFAVRHGGAVLVILLFAVAG